MQCLRRCLSSRLTGHYQGGNIPSILQSYYLFVMCVCTCVAADCDRAPHNKLLNDRFLISYFHHLAWEFFCSMSLSTLSFVPLSDLRSGGTIMWSTIGWIGIPTTLSPAPSDLVGSHSDRFLRRSAIRCLFCLGSRGSRPLEWSTIRPWTGGFDSESTLPALAGGSALGVGGGLI
jgi:hypothetical protein